MVAMSQGEHFRRYGALVSAAAEAALGGARGAAATGADAEAGDSLAMAHDAAALLLHDEPARYVGLARAMQRLATLGRPWATVGVNVGALGALVDSPGAVASRAKVEALLKQFSRGEAAQPFIMLTDGAGHRREVYHPLALHLCLTAFERRYESLPQALWARCEQAVPEAVAPCRLIEFFADYAAPPGLVALALWQALCLADQARLTKRDVDLELVDSVVANIVATNGDGALHTMRGDDTLDTWTYRELVGLHALAHLALTRRNRGWAKRVEQVALYHLENTQPDNATNQPWAVFAFLWSPRTASFAEQQLHDCTVHAASGDATGGAGLVAGLLLADAASALNEFA